MASRILNPSLSFFHIRLAPTTLAAGLGVSTALIAPFLLSHRQSHLIRLDSSPSPVSAKGWSRSQYQTDAKTPITRRDGRLNPGAVRQISSGSIIGLIAGLGVSLFSRSLAVLLGLLIVGAQTAEHYGIHILPYSRLQKYFGRVDLRSAVQDNAALKISFGTMFALSAFAEL